MTIALAVALLVIAAQTGRNIALTRKVRALEETKFLDDERIYRAERDVNRLVAAERRRVALLDENRRNADRAFGASAGPLS